MYNSKDKRGIYILHAMEDISLNGDSYTTAEALFKASQRNDRRLSKLLSGRTSVSCSTMAGST